MECVPSYRLRVLSSKESSERERRPRCYIWAIEEPFKAHEFSSMVKIAKTLNLKIILDESFLNSNSLKQIQNQSDIFIPNLRISKLGGVLRTIELIRELENQNFQWILGSHVGEMSLLTRASLLILKIQRKNSLVAKEGAFSTHLLSVDPFYPNIKFALGAKLKKIPELSSGWNMKYIYKQKG